MFGLLGNYPSKSPANESRWSLFTIAKKTCFLAFFGGSANNICLDMFWIHEDQWVLFTVSYALVCWPLVIEKNTGNRVIQRVSSAQSVVVAQVWVWPWRNPYLFLHGMTENPLAQSGPANHRWWTWWMKVVCSLVTRLLMPVCKPDECSLSPFAKFQERLY